MKTNISALMSLISEEERNLNNLIRNAKGHLFNTTIEELNGRTNIIEDYKSDLDEELENIERTYTKLSKLKSVLHEKNNTLTLKDGRTIVCAISDNTYLRKIKEFYEGMITYRSTKSRVTEVNNSYFESHTLNFDVKEIKTKLEAIDSQIRETDFEISKLNSIEFDIEL